MRPLPAGRVHDFSARTIDGVEQPLSAFAGQVLLLVNVASRCGFTPQYAGLEALWRQYRERGFAVLGFPCNQFGRQEPEGEAAIREFCTLRFGVSFPLFGKVEVNGPGAHPLFGLLRAACPGIAGTGSIKWNFTKFLVDRDGRPVRRFGPAATPAQLRPHIESLLAAVRPEYDARSNPGESRIHE
jgi:glutathione peroxidase